MWINTEPERTQCPKHPHEFIQQHRNKVGENSSVHRDFTLQIKLWRGYSEDKTLFTHVHTHKHFRHCHTVNPGLTYGSNTISIKEKACLEVHKNPPNTKCYNTCQKYTGKTKLAK